MASTSDTTTEKISIVEEWTSSLEDLIVPNSALEGSTIDKLESGSYSQTNVIVKLNGAKCVSKTVQTFLFAKNEFRKLFIDGCLQLSKLKHPNLVQLLGVQLNEADNPPALFFEFFPLSLESCLQKYPSIPKDVKYSMLSDVSKGLQYLHCGSSPIAHGRLNAHNILLTASLQAKISDLVRFGAQAPDSEDSPYQPPEEIPSIGGDIFCFGDLIIHVVLQQSPKKLEPKLSDEESKLSEVERRKKYFNLLEDNQQPLKELAINCLNDNPILRPTSSSLSRDLDKTIATIQPEFENILDMHHALEKLALSKETIESLNRTIQGKEVEIEALKQQIEPLKNDLAANEERLQAQIQEVDSYKQALQAKEARIRAHESGNRAKEALIKAKDREIAAKKQDVIAKESLLRASQKRIESLEHQVLALRKGVDIPLSPVSLPNHDSRLTNRAVSSSPTHLQPAAPEVVKADKHEVVYRKNRGRVGRNAGIFSDGFAYQDVALQRAKSMGANEYDPVLANILARQHQKIEEAESISENQEQRVTNEEKPKAIPPPVRPKRSRANSLTTSDLTNVIQASSDVSN